MTCNFVAQVKLTLVKQGFFFFLKGSRKTGERLRAAVFSECKSHDANL